jgi:signal transduction histidine kinase
VPGVTVRDTGIGLTSDQRGRLFKRFSQVGVGAGRRQGTGLGLAICRTLVEAMGGRIEVSVTAGRGLVLRLPHSRAVAATSPSR